MKRIMALHLVASNMTVLAAGGTVEVVKDGPDDVIELRGKPLTDVYAAEVHLSELDLYERDLQPIKPHPRHQTHPSNPKRRR